MKRKIVTGTVVRDQEGREAVVKFCADKDTFVIQYIDPFWPFPQRGQITRSQMSVVDVQYPEAPF